MRASTPSSADCSGTWRWWQTLGSAAITPRSDSLTSCGSIEERRRRGTTPCSAIAATSRAPARGGAPPAAPPPPAPRRDRARERVEATQTDHVIDGLEGCGLVRLRLRVAAGQDDARPRVQAPRAAHEAAALGVGRV